MPLRIWCSDLCGRNKEINKNPENPQILPVFPELWAAQGLGLINRLLAWPPKFKTSGADDKYCIALGIFFAILQFLKEIDIEQIFI